MKTPSVSFKRVAFPPVSTPRRAGAPHHTAERTAARLVGIVLVTALGCGAESRESPPPPDGPLNHDSMYSLAVLPTFELEIGPKALSELEKAPKQYTEVTFLSGDERITHVGLRLKGSYTLTTLDQKPSFKIKFNKYVKGQRFLGYEELILQNFYQDASMIREHMSYWIFRQLGVPGPRTGYATVMVNGEDKGLYLNLESYSDDFLERVFADPTGNLYEAESGDDVNGDVLNFDQDEGEDTSYGDLRALKVQATDPSDAVFSAPDGLVDTSEFQAYVLGEAMVGHFDGYLLPHNYYMYNEPAAERWVWLPWNLDQTLIRHTSVWEGRGYLWKKCRDSDTCRLAYVRQSQELLAELQGLDVSGEIDRVTAAIDLLAHADPAKRYSNKQLEGGWGGVRGYLGARPGELSQELDCLVDGQEPDADGDGYGACWEDCNDHDKTIHRGAEELCDGIDNDCSGFADDVPSCPCPAEEVLGATFHFCTNVLRWTAARDFCKAQGNELLRLDSPEQNEAVWAIARKKSGGTWALGLNDRGVEDDYRWQDGSKPSFTAWAPGQPSKELPWFDCVFYSGGQKAQWRERNCTEKTRFICREPD